MAERDSKDHAIIFSQLRGVNERMAADNLPEGEFSILQGLYPSKVGQLSRMPGTTRLRNDGAEVLGIHQTFDALDHILIQTANDLRIYTLDELLFREITPALVYTPLTEEESMSIAVLVHRENNNTVGGALGAAANTFYTRELNAMLVNETATVVSLATNIFTLAAGTYRIDGVVLNGFDTRACGVQTFLFNETDGVPAYWTGTTDPIVFTAGRVLSNNVNVGQNQQSHVNAHLTVAAGPNKGFSIKQAMSDALSAADTSATGKRSTLTLSLTGTASPAMEYYAFIRILKTA